MRVQHFAFALAALLLVGAAGASAQGGNPDSNQPAPVKIGVLSVQQAISSTAEGKQALAELQSQFAPRQTEMENLQKQIDELQKRLENCARTCSDEEKARIQREGQQKTTRLQRLQTELQDDANAAQADVIDRIGRKLLDIVDRYAREKSYMAVFDISAQTNPLLYYPQSSNITQDIVRLYDQQYPIKGGAPAKQPSKPPSEPPKQPSSTTQPPKKPGTPQP